MAQTLGEIATSVTSSFSDTAKLITASSYLAGIGFSAASIMKFKAHKDNPTQIPVGTPEALIAVAAVMTFMPSLEGAAKAAGITTSDVKEAASAAGVTKADVEAAAEQAGATPTEVSAAEGEIKKELSG